MLVEVYNSSLKKKAILNEIVSYRYKRYFYSIGDFELTVLESDPGEPYAVNPGDILYVYDNENGDDSLYVTTVTAEKGRIKFSGKDLKIILNWRITLFPTKELEAGTYGYDCRTGYTGDIVKKYIDYNLCEASNPDRKLSISYCTTEPNIGVENDTYMSRLQPLNEVVEELCANGGIGYKITLDPFSCMIIINIFEGTDKRSGIGFGTYIGNADSVRKIRDNTSERSIAWAVNGTDANNSTVTAVTLESGTEGLTRKETVVTINCDNDDVSLYAKHSAGECTVTEEIDASVNVKGMEHEVGDIVIVYDDLGGYNEMRINAIEKEYSGCKMRKNLFFVDYQAPVSRKKTLTKLAAASSTTQKDIIDQKLDSGSGDEEENDGLTIENAVIIQEADAKYLLHEYTQIEYIAGNRIGYSGVINQIIVQGYVVDSRNNIAANTTTESLPNIQLHSDMVFEVPGYMPAFKSAFNRIYLKFDSASTTATYYKIIYVGTDGSENSYSSITAWGTSGERFAAIGIVWQNIFPPGYTVNGTEFEFGCAQCGLVQVTTANTDTKKYQIGAIATGSYMPYIPFASEAEYNAAVGLTYEPISLTQVNETTTIV